MSDPDREQIREAAGPEPFASESSAATAHLPPGAPGPHWRTFDRLVVVAFVAGLLVPSALLLAGRRPAEVENRPLRTLPALSLGGVLDGTWTAGVDAFLADGVAVRPYAIRLRGEVEWLTGGTGNPAVLRGRDGWLFTAGEFAPNCQFTAGQLVAGLRAGASRLRAAGQDLHVLVIPDKHSIYPDKVAANPFPPACSELGRATLRGALADLAPITVDGFSVLETARAADPAGPLLYFPLDSHWTPRGAIAAIRPLIESIDPRLWSQDDVRLTGTARLRDDLAAQMGIRRTGSVPGVVVRPGGIVERSDVTVPVAVHNARAVFRTQARGDRPVLPGRTVIVYDSFFGIDVGLVAPFFADATWIHVGDLLNHPELARLTGPFDHVVFERVERGLYQTDVGAVLSALVR